MTHLRSALIIDDDPIQRELVANHLRKIGLQTILTAVDGRDAKAKIAGQGASLDVILSDLNMPEFDGIEFLMFLRDQKLRAALVFVTGAPPAVTKAADKLATAYDINYRGLLAKPLDFQALDRLLAAIPPAAP